MLLVIRRFLAILASCGLTAGITAYVESYKGTTFDSLIPSPLILHLGVFVVNVPMMLIESSSFNVKTPAWIWFPGGQSIERGSFSWTGYAQGAPLWEEAFYWKEFSKGMPRWVVPAIKLLGLFFFFHFILFLIQTHAASVEIKNGQYVLDNHGQILKTLTEPEYFRLKAAELRMFAALWIFFYFVPTMYWWFPRNRHGSIHPAAQ